MREIITRILEASIAAKRDCITANIELIVRAADMLAACVGGGGKILIFGNGGSAADAQHLAAEFVNRFQIDRPPLAAVALTTNSSILTAVGNDDSFDAIFSKQIAALGKKGDIAWAISTSGDSANVIEGVQSARSIGMPTIGMTGRGGRLADCADLVLRVPSDTVARIQESHILLGHILCDLVERRLYPDEFR
jgi:D-sedoheptulose 7-phosphate isomerase